MSIEETFGAMLEAKLQAQLAPVRNELARVTSELEAVRRALPAQLVPVAEAARVLGVSVATVRRRVKEGSLPSRRIGRALRVDLSAQRAATVAEVVEMVDVVRRR